MGNTPSVLSLQTSRARMLLLLAAPPVAAAVGLVWTGLAQGLGLWVLLIAGPILLVGLFGAVYALHPVRLIADAEGLTYSSLVSRRRMLWSDIEAIGVASDRSWDGWDRPVVRALGVRPPRTARRLFIGVNYRPGRSPEKDAGKRAYRSGFTGYELNLPHVFDHPVAEIVDDLQARLAVSRNA